MITFEFLAFNSSIKNKYNRDRIKIKIMFAFIHTPVLKVVKIL